MTAGTSPFLRSCLAALEPLVLRSWTSRTNASAMGSSVTIYQGDEFPHLSIASGEQILFENRLELQEDNAKICLSESRRAQSRESPPPSGSHRRRERRPH